MWGIKPGFVYWKYHFSVQNTDELEVEWMSEDP